MAWKQYYQVKHQSCKSFWHCSEKSINVIQVISCFKLLFDLKDVSCRCSKLFIGSNKRRDNVMTDARVQNWWWHPLSNTDKPTDEWTDGAWCHETGQLRSHVSCGRIYLLSRYTPKSESTDHRRRYSVLKWFREARGCYIIIK